jgi:hypothetical protein
MIFLVKSSKMQNLQAPNIEKVLLMIKAFNRKTLWLWVSNFLLLHDLWTILFQTFKYSINNKFNFSMCRVQIWPPEPSLVNNMRLSIAEGTLWPAQQTPPRAVSSPPSPLPPPCCCCSSVAVGRTAGQLVSWASARGVPKWVKNFNWVFLRIFLRIC